MVTKRMKEKVICCEGLFYILYIKYYTYINIFENAKYPTHVAAAILHVL
jgi:hypothetical protein